MKNVKVIFENIFFLVIRHERSASAAERLIRNEDHEEDGNESEMESQPPASIFVNHVNANTNGSNDDDGGNHRNPSPPDAWRGHFSARFR